MSSSTAGSNSNYTTFGSLSNDEKTTLLFKKLMGKPSTVHTNAFFAEPGLSLKSVISSQQLWVDDFPNTPAGFGNADGNAAGNATHANVDLTGVPFESDYKDSTDAVLNKNANIVKLVKLQLNPIAAANGLAYEHPLLKDAIPFNFGDGSSYNYNLYLHPDKNSGKPIAFGPGGGDWIVDPDAGILTFYNKGAAFVTSDVTMEKPPSITFYRYVGRKGLGSILNSTPKFNNALVEGDLEVTGKVNLSGSDPGITVGSSTSVASMNNNNAPFVQFGSDNLGAWRFSIQKNGDQGLSDLLVESKMDDGVGGQEWKTVNSFSNYIN